ncbi:defective in methylation-7 protein-like protein [Colletotrichum musicola]|uniref:Defective in methylation-7 protein-like protein n=1 Tax=Colletotrichum musicola TaxID=2175873 RepID=A0A8H6N910_9PEZI|nr:defective in methylation-7 protein-like protein [Colletotrichum musicola]
MVGRRRRTSDTAAGTVDDGHGYVEELTVLKKFSPELDAVDSMLQTFVLEDATVCDKTGRPVELFTVKTKGPFTVRGRVIIDDERKSRAKKPNTKYALIETKQCLRYAIGENDTGTYGAWALGAAGWYEIRPPSATYKPIYDRMVEGVSIYYTVMTAIEEHMAQEGKGKKGKGRKKKSGTHNELSIEEVLLKYAVAIGDGATYDEVIARCDNHAPFLISHFYEDSHAFDWPPTVFFKWLVERHPETHANVLEARNKVIPAPPIQELPEETAAVETPVAVDEPPAQKTLARRTRRTTPQDANVTSDESNNHDAAALQRSVRSRSRAKTKTPSRSPPPSQVVEPMDVDAPPASAPAETTSGDVAQPSHIDLLMEGIQEIRPELEPLSKAALSKVSSKLYYKYRIKNYHSSSEILLYYARELLQRLDEREWGESGFWTKLQEAASKPRLELLHIEYDQIPSNLIRRKTLAAPRVHKKPGEEGETPQPALETPQPRRIGRPAGKMSALRLVGGKGSKRRFDSDDETPDTVSRGSKAAKRSHGDDSDDDNMDAGSSSAESDGSEPDTADSPAALKVVVRAENIPTSDAKGPNGTWVCEEDDCGFVVRNPDQEDGHEEIREHMQEAHYEDDEDRDARINLAVTEGVKNHLPIEYFSPPPSPPYFRYSCLLSNDQPEVSPFWDSGPSGPATATDAKASSPRSVTVAESSDEDDVPPGTSLKIRRMGQKVQEKEEILLDDIPLTQPIKRRLIS